MTFTEVGGAVYTFKADTTGLKTGCGRSAREAAGNVSLGQQPTEMRRCFEETRAALQGVNAAAQVFISVARTAEAGLTAVLRMLCLAEDALPLWNKSRCLQGSVEMQIASGHC